AAGAAMGAHRRRTGLSLWLATHRPGVVAAAGRRGGDGHGRPLARHTAAGRHTGRMLASLYGRLAVHPQAPVLALSPGLPALFSLGVSPCVAVVRCGASVQLQSAPYAAVALAPAGPASVADRPGAWLAARQAGHRRLQALASHGRCRPLPSW